MSQPPPPPDPDLSTTHDHDSGVWYPDCPACPAEPEPGVPRGEPRGTA